MTLKKCSVEVSPTYERMSGVECYVLPPNLKGNKNVLEDEVSNK